MTRVSAKFHTSNVIAAPNFNNIRAFLLDVHVFNYFRTILRTRVLYRTWINCKKKKKQTNKQTKKRLFPSHFLLLAAIKHRNVKLEWECQALLVSATRLLQISLKVARSCLNFLCEKLLKRCPLPGHFCKVACSSFFANAARMYNINAI